MISMQTLLSKLGWSHHLSIYQNQLFFQSKGAPDTSPIRPMQQAQCSSKEEQWVVWAALLWMGGKTSCVICNHKLMAFVAMVCRDLWVGRGRRHARQGSCSFFSVLVAFKKSQMYPLSARKNEVTVVHVSPQIRVDRCWVSVELSYKYLLLSSC